MRDGSTRLTGADRLLRDVLRREWYRCKPRRGVVATGDGAGEDDFVFHWFAPSSKKSISAVASAAGACTDGIWPPSISMYRAFFTRLATISVSAGRSTRSWRPAMKNLGQLIVSRAP